MAVNKYYGKYRAEVVDINDPEKRSRIKVICPSVLGEGNSPWCEICVPVAYDGGGDFCLPKIGEFVWIEFEEGDSNKPIYVGGCWSVNNTPLSDYGEAPTTRIIDFDGSRIIMKKGEMTITAGGATIILKEGKIYLN